jgi:hypothetical protein
MFLFGFSFNGNLKFLSNRQPLCFYAIVKKTMIKNSGLFAYWWFNRNISSQIFNLPVFCPVIFLIWPSAYWWPNKQLPFGFYVINISSTPAGD